MKWIDIKKNIPFDGEDVLITNGHIVTAATVNHGNYGIYWNGCEFGGYEWDWDFDEESITHWAPIPDPPKMGVR